MNLPMPVAVGIWIVLGVLLLLVVLGGRRRLARRTGRLVPAPPAPPAGSALGASRLEPVEATYVSTTLAGDWLARVGAHGLGDRASATVSVHDAGVLVERAGAAPLFLPAGALRGAGLAPGMAGKYVGADGIVVLTWHAPSDGSVPAVDLDTGLRTRHPADKSRLVDAVRHLAAATAGATDTPQKENL
ncbi:hypothetical protein ET495_04905 [Xylanimonas allomyrinae]|uniref:PH domain-containing protein n=1 Tax=Xylanimonas allomyrinae TaxID=2509459 RepID=A0A4P6EKN5_9MICO|nr:hypothetical protein [Xylanimonas allomyrinae]QAY62706.1 hypothetical protein ET495_04905 [Xylanimonas allomyrinae]